MPIYQVQCKECGFLDDVIMSWESWKLMKEKVDAGEFFHELMMADGTSMDCGTIVRKITLPNVYSPPGAYPWQAPPWLFPPVINEKTGLAEPQQPMINNRREYLNLMKKHGMTENLSPGERLTNYEDRPKGSNIDKVVNEDMKMYTHFKSNPEARRKVIRNAITQRNDAISKGILT